MLTPRPHIPAKCLTSLMWSICSSGRLTLIPFGASSGWSSVPYGLYLLVLLGEHDSSIEELVDGLPSHDGAVTPVPSILP